MSGVVAVAEAVFAVVDGVVLKLVSFAVTGGVAVAGLAAAVRVVVTEVLLAGLLF